MACSPTFTYICHENQSSVGKYIIHGSYGEWHHALGFCLSLQLLQDWTVKSTGLRLHVGGFQKQVTKAQLGSNQLKHMSQNGFIFPNFRGEQNPEKSSIASAKPGKLEVFSQYCLYRPRTLSGWVDWTRLKKTSWPSLEYPSPSHEGHPRMINHQP